MFITHDDFWRRFAEEVGHPEWVSDPCFATMAARRDNREQVLKVVGELLARDTTDHWASRLAPLGLVVAPVETLEQALASEHTLARAMVAEIPTPGGVIRVVGNPIKFPDVKDCYDAPPQLGQHNEVLLRAHSG